VRTESSIRFEHGVDWEAVEEALDRGAALIAELGRGEGLKGKIDAMAKERKPKTVELRVERVNSILGTDISAGDMISILKRLGFEVKKVDSRKLKVDIPLFRAMDIEREIDLIEEIARIWGFGRIETTMPNTAFSGKEEDKEDVLRSKVAEILVGCGLNEVQTYSMLGPKDFDNTGIPADKTVKISNPLNIEESIMRTHILPGLLKVAAYNQNRQIENVFFFEIGKVFKPSKEKLPQEKWHLGGVMTGSPFMSALDKGEADYFYVKGIMDNLFRDLGIEMPKLSETENFLLQPGKAAEIEGVGILGGLHPDIQRNYELNKPVMVFEIDLDALFKLLPEEKRCSPLPRFPWVSRDISMFISSELENQKLVEMIKRVGGEIIEDVFPFDKYKDSIAYRVIYRNPARTLTEEEVNSKHEEILKTLESKLNVRIRR
jgi:phenylalanyl-tRNA synthetase beta chain